jgi:uncharacterized protein
MSAWIMTATGRVFYPLEPRAEDVCIDDIAHALAGVNRFNGHTRVPYSVAQHSVLVSQQLYDHGLDLELIGLLHDASEAYLGDVPRPLKVTEAFEPYRQAEERLQALIYQVFGVEVVAAHPSVTALVKHVDRRMLRTEQAALMPPAAPGENRRDTLPYTVAIDPWSAREARGRFLTRFHWIRARMKAQAALAGHPHVAH